MGRRAKLGHRTKSGRLSRAYKGPARDDGTHEVQAKRAALVGKDHEGKPNDPALAESTPGILFAHQHLDRDQFNEALEYRRIRCALYGPPWPHVSSGSEISADKLAEIKDRFDAKVERLSKEQRHVVNEVCVFGHIPQWFYVELLGLHALPEDAVEKEALIAGLDLLLGRPKRKSEIRTNVAASRRAARVRLEEADAVRASPVE